MSTHPIPAPDWFDHFWEEQKHRLPAYLRNDATKKLARELLNASVSSAAKYASTPQGVRGLIALARITAIVKGVTGVCEAPEPSPEEVADAVQKLVQRITA